MFIQQESNKGDICTRKGAEYDGKCPSEPLFELINAPAIVAEKILKNRITNQGEMHLKDEVKGLENHRYLVFRSYISAPLIARTKS